MREVRVDDAADPRLADYALLDGHGALRTHVGDDRFVAEGPIAIARTLDSGHRLRSVVVTPQRRDALLAAVPDLATTDVDCFVLERDLLADVVGFDLHRGVLAAADRRPATPLAELAASARRAVVLVGLNDAQNVGLIARTARALGADALVLDPRCTDPYARRTVRVSMGEVLHLPTARAEAWPEGLDVLHAAGVETWALTPAVDADDLWAATAGALPERLAIVLGAEGPGLDPATMGRAARRVRIPIAPDVDSLNVGHAAAVALAAIGRADRAHDTGDRPGASSRTHEGV